MKTEKTNVNPEATEETAVVTTEATASFAGETEPLEGEVISMEEASEAMAENVVEDSEVFEARISGFSPRLKAQSRALHKAIKDEATGRITQAKILYAIDTQKLLKGTEFKGLGEYAMEVFGMQKSLASRLKNTYARFYAVPLTAADGHQLKLTLSQAEELLAANDDDVQAMVDSGEITDEMSAKDIRAVIKGKKPVKEAPAKVYKWKPVCMNATDDGMKLVAAENAEFTSTAALLSECAAKLSGCPVYVMLSGTSADGDIVHAIMQDGSTWSWLNLGEVKPEKKTSKK